MSDDDPFGGLDEDDYLPPESAVDPDEDLDVDEEAAAADDADAEGRDEPEDPDEPEEEPAEEEPPEDEEWEEPAAEEEEDPSEEEPEAPDEDEPPEEPEPDDAPEPEPVAAEAEGSGDPWDDMDDDAYVPPEGQADPSDFVDDEPEDEAPEEEEPPEEPEPDDVPEPEPVAPAAGGEAAEADEGGDEGPAPEEPPDEDLRIEDILRQEEPEPPEEPDEVDEGPEGVPAEAAAAGVGAEDGEIEGEPPDPWAEEGEEPGTEPWEEALEEPAEEPVPDAGEADEEPVEEEPEEAPPPGHGGPPAGPDDQRDRPDPDLPGVGSVLVAEVIDGLGSRRVAGTLLALGLTLVGAAYWRGLSDTGWFLRTAFLFTPALLLPAYTFRFPVERRTGHDRIVGTYPVGPGRYLAGRYVAYLLLGVSYLAVAVAVAAPVAWFAGPHWVNQIPRLVGVGALVVAATASAGVLLGTLLGGVRGSVAAFVGLVVGVLWYLAPRGVYLAERLPSLTAYAGTATQALAVKVLHLSPAVAATSLVVEPEVFPVLASPLVKAAVLPAMAVVFLLLGGLAFVYLQGPGGWSAHPALILVFAAAVLVTLAAPVAMPVELDRGDPVVERTQASGIDVTVDAKQDLRGAEGGPTVEGAITKGASYDGFLTLVLTRSNQTANTSLSDVRVEARSDVLFVGDGVDLGTVTVPGAQDTPAEVPLDIPVTAASVPGAYRPADATAFVEVTSNEADFTVVVEDLETATTSDLVRWAPPAVVAGLALLEVAVLALARRQP